MAGSHRGFPYKFGDPSEVSSASTMRRTDGAAWLAVGATVDALDEYPGVKTGVLQRKWRVANVVRLGDGHDDERAAKVAYEGFASK